MEACSTACEAWPTPRIGFGSTCVSKRANEPRPAALRRHDPSLTAMLFLCGETCVLEACIAVAFEGWLTARIGFGSICVSKRANEPRPRALRRHDPSLNGT